MDKVGQIIPLPATSQDHQREQQGIYSIDNLKWKINWPY
jgi:hypothetical protein